MDSKKIEPTNPSAQVADEAAPKGKLASRVAAAAKFGRKSGRKTNQSRFF